MPRSEDCFASFVCHLVCQVKSSFSCFEVSQGGGGGGRLLVIKIV